MGQASNRKWTRRIANYLKAKSVTEQLRLRRLFAWHRKFQVQA